MTECSEFRLKPIVLCHRKNLASKCPCKSCEHYLPRKDGFGYIEFACTKYDSSGLCKDYFFWLHECQFKLQDAERKIDLSAIEEENDETTCKTGSPI